MNGLMSYVDEILSRGDYPDTGGTMESMAMVRNPMIERVDSMADNQGLIDVTPYIMSSFIKAPPLSRGIQTPTRVYNQPSGLDKLIEKAIRNAKPEDDMVKWVGKDAATELARTSVARAFGKQYYSPTSTYQAPSQLELFTGRLINSMDDPMVRGSMGGVGLGYRMIGENDE